MRLPNTKEIIVKSFPSPARPEIPDYVILSHRWRNQEISFQDIQHCKAGDITEGLKHIEGFDKILHCCQEAQSVGIKYAWVDTCCINKTDQVELTEALNSMFRWYGKAQRGSKFRQSEWFTRGWTLQELVAPQHLTFFGSDWEEIGTKSSFQAVITDITGIPDQVLLTNSVDDSSVAQIIPWAAKRETARELDRAYCLMGLFNVSMPMNYGEGFNAFRRLQLEIMRFSDNHTIFAWTGTNHGEKRGLLAASPREFEHCADVQRYGNSWAFSTTNNGINMKIPLSLHRESPQGKRTLLGVLSCQRKVGVQYPDRYPMVIYLERDREEDPASYIRVQPGKTEEIESGVSSYARGMELCVRETNHSSFQEPQPSNDDRFIDSGLPPHAFVTLKHPLRSSGRGRRKLTPNCLGWMRPESEQRFFFSIKQRRGENALPDVDSADLDTFPKWGIKKEQIGLSFPTGSGCNPVLIFKSTNDCIFAISLHVHNYRVWSAMTISSDADIQRIASEYWARQMEKARWDSMSRRKLALGEGEVASLAIRKGRRDGQRVYLIEIDAGENFWLEKVCKGNFPGWWNAEKNEKTIWSSILARL